MASLNQTGVLPEPIKEEIAPKDNPAVYSSIGIFNPSPAPKVVLIPIKVGFWERIASLFPFWERK